MQKFTIADITVQRFEVVDRVIAQDGKQALEIFKQQLSCVIPYEIHQIDTLWVMTNPFGSKFVALRCNDTK